MIMMTSKTLITWMAMISFLSISKSLMILAWEMYLSMTEALMVFLSLMILLFMFVKTFSMVNIFSWNKATLSSMAVIMVCILVFLECNKLMFFIAFEISMIPMFVSMIEFSKEKSKISSSVIMMLINMSMATPTLIFIMKEYFQLYTMNWLMLSYSNLKMEENLFMIYGMLMMMTKVPIFFLHIWLPKAHVESFTLGSIILASLMLKLGIVGMLKLIPSMEEKFMNVSWILLSVAWLTLVYSLNMMARSTDIKKVAATSSIAHMGVTIASLSSMKSTGMISTVLMSFSHGLVSAFMFFLIGMFYESTESRSIFSNSSIESVSKNKSLLWIFIMFLNIGLPPTMSFYSEVVMMLNFMTLSYYGAFFLGVSMMFVSASSMITAVKSIFKKNQKFFNAKKNEISYLNSMGLSFVYMLIFSMKVI